MSFDDLLGTWAFPDHQGGPLFMADEIGLERVLAGM